MVGLWKSRTLRCAVIRLGVIVNIVLPNRLECVLRGCLGRNASCTFDRGRDRGIVRDHKIDVTLFVFAQRLLKVRPF